MFWVAYQKVRKGIKAARENVKRKPADQTRNPNWQWLLGKSRDPRTVNRIFFRNSVFLGSILFNYFADSNNDLYANGTSISTPVIWMYQSAKPS